MEFHRRTLRFETSSFLPYKDERNGFGIDFRDATNMLGGWYWYDRLKTWETPEAGFTLDEIFENIALVQYVPYSSVKFEDLPKGTVLPSQKFTCMMIRYIAENNHDTVFLVPRAVWQWKNLLGDTWNLLNNRIFILDSKYARSQTLKPECIGTKAFSAIIKAIKGF